MLSKKTTIRALALMLVIALAALALPGCSASNPNVTVLLVGDIKIGMTKYYSLYSSYKNLYNSYGLYDVSSAEKLRNFQNIIFDMLVESYLPLYQAQQADVTLTEEEEAKVQSDFEDQLSGYLDGYAEQVDSSITDEGAIRDAELKLFKKDLRSNGWTYREYTNMMVENVRGQAIASKYMDGIYAERVSVTDEDVQNHYTELLSTEQAAYASDPTQYYTEYYDHFNNDTQQPLVAPEGYRLVKHILIKFAEEGENKDVDAIVAEVQAKIDAGENFDELIKEYGEDTGMESDPYMTYGYLISTETMDKYDESFAAAAMALKNIGDITAPIESTYGYHFIQYTSDVSTTPLSYDEAKDAMKETMIADAKSAVYAELIEQWTTDTNVVKYYDRVNSIR